VTPRILVQRLLRAVHLDGSPAYRGLRGVGQRWEDLAGKRLEAEGYEIRERNYRARSGEVDFIAEEKGILCFVEVKGRRSARFGLPAEAVTLEKQRRIFRAAQEYVYVGEDLRHIAIVGSSMFVVLILLWLVVVVANVFGLY